MLKPGFCCLGALGWPLAEAASSVLSPLLEVVQAQSGVQGTAGAEVALARLGPGGMRGEWRGGPTVPAETVTATLGTATCQPLRDTQRPGHPQGLPPFPQGCRGSERARNLLHSRGRAFRPVCLLSPPSHPPTPPHVRRHHSGSACWELRSRDAAPSQGFPGDSVGKESASNAGDRV